LNKLRKKITFNDACELHRMIIWQWMY